MKTVLGLQTGQNIAVCRERPLPLALLEPQPAVTQKPGELLASPGSRAGRDQRAVQLLGHVKMVAVKPPSSYTGPSGERVELVIGSVADDVRPQPAVRGPAWWVDPDRHRRLPASGCRP